MKYFVQVKFREFQMTPKRQEFQISSFVIFQNLHFGPQIFQKYQFDPQ